jgi:hypothetical protein
MKITIPFAFERETPGAIRYQEVDQKGAPRKNDLQKAVIGTLYLRKAQIDGAAPSTLT